MLTMLPAAASPHPPGDRLAAVERAAEVDRDHVLPLVRRHRVDVADLAHARAVDEDVDPAGGVDDALRPRARRQPGRGRRPRRRDAIRARRRASAATSAPPRLARAVERRDPRPLARRIAPRSPCRCRCRHPSRMRPDPRAARMPPVRLSTGWSPSSIAHMDEAVATNAPWEITGARHGGITVSDLDRSLEFYVGLVGLELVWRREYVERRDPRDRRHPRRDLGRHRDARHPGRRRAGRAARVPGLRAQVGQHAAVATTAPATSASSCATSRRCHAELAAQGVRFRSDGPVEMLEGPNTGGKSLYAHRPRRLHLRVPRAAAACRCLTSRAPSPRGRPTGRR